MSREDRLAEALRRIAISERESLDDLRSAAEGHSTPLSVTLRRIAREALDGG